MKLTNSTIKSSTQLSPAKDDNTSKLPNTHVGLLVDVKRTLASWLVLIDKNIFELDKEGKTKESRLWMERGENISRLLKDSDLPNRAIFINKEQLSQAALENPKFATIFESKKAFLDDLIETQEKRTPNTRNGGSNARRS